MPIHRSTPLHRARLLLLAASALTAVATVPAMAQPAETDGQTLTLNDKGYFASRGFDVLVYSNWYDGLFSDAKMSGVEIIHHDQRTATNGDIRLSATPDQWDPIGTLVSRKVDQARGTIDTHLSYPDYHFDYRINAHKDGDKVVISVILDKPLPAALDGKAGFNLEFLPATYFHQSYFADGVAHPFPLYPASAMTQPTASQRAEPLPMASGQRFVLAPTDPQQRVTVSAANGTMSFYDGRNQAQNGWFVLRQMIPAGKTGTVLQWTLSGSTDPHWVRPTVIGHSQVGYAPAQQKIAVLEHDPQAPLSGEARLLRVTPDGKETAVFSAAPKPWGDYLRYGYARFDFSSVTQPGLYVIDYDGQRTAPFPIAKDVYAAAWHPTLDIYLPEQMDHMRVAEAYRVWHGDPHRDDARQAPVNHEHFDLYAQGPTTDTAFKPGEHIPGLNVGGWLDAGDYDIRTQTQYAIVRTLVHSWEDFRPERDTTSVDWSTRRVDLHRPDGVPDILQQIKHGTVQLVAQFDAVGHAIHGIVEPDLVQYRHLGDAVTKTDGLVYDPSLKEGEVKGDRSGTPDDRWAFTSKSSALNYGSIGALAAASRALRDMDPALAKKSLAIAQKVWAEEQSHAPDLYRHGNTTGGPLQGEEFNAAVELLISTGDAKYAARISALWPWVAEHFVFNATEAVRALPHMPAAYRSQLETAVRAYAKQRASISKANPYGVPITEGGWAGNGAIVRLGITDYALHKAFPDIIDGQGVFRGLDYLYGTHPGSNLSFVSAVGARSKEVAYGHNRADFSFIAGGVVPGVLIVKPDFPENKENWPFFWGENEYVTDLGAYYIYLANAANALVEGSHPAR
jgi:hypothetical protein